eukprot:CAMPEP_0115253548 /NCGR_PEP_ID=MMETSP0270-20121206/44727_1 /TAXON_ID=71861 /ORGANISM="Scrippsiella trochoidea, Strain CCMP3099" /LENGTH=93 /DNA_ID=CAMNT_0002669053 /DNA_START=654 /DNA_END=935 /DNA_ORIENTATION=+
MTDVNLHHLHDWGQVEKRGAQIGRMLEEPCGRPPCGGPHVWLKRASHSAGNLLHPNEPHTIRQHHHASNRDDKACPSNFEPALSWSTCNTCSL